MSKRNIQKHENQAIRQVFTEAGNPSAVCLVGIDLAKQKHVVSLCNAHGELFGKQLSVHNTQAGIDYLESAIRKQCDVHGIKAEHVVLGVESPGNWAANFVWALSQRHEQVIQLHPARVRQFCENATTSNDRLSSQLICRALANKVGRSSYHDEIYDELREATRTRRRLVRKRTRASNQLHSCSEICLPGFLSDTSPIGAFTQASLAIMARYTLDSLARCRPTTLEKLLRKHRVHHVDRVVGELKRFAKGAIAPYPAQARARQREMRYLVEQYQLYHTQIAAEEQAIATLLRQTPGCLLTTVGGVNIVTAAELTGELGGCPAAWNASQKACYFGLTERTRQTGGPDHAPRPPARPIAYSHQAKNIILRISDNLAIHGPSEYKHYHQQRQDHGQNARYSLARRFLRFALNVLREPHEYHSPLLRDLLAQPHHPLWEPHFQQLQERLQRIWRPYHIDLDPAQDILHQWQHMVEQHHGITITL